MKRAVMTALVVSLLGGTSALAQGGPLSRVVRENQAQNEGQSQPQRSAPPPRESRPQPQAAPAQSQPQAPAQSRGDAGRRGDGGGRGGQSPLANVAQQAQQQQQGQRSQGGWQGQRRPDGQGAQNQGRPGAQQGQGQRPGAQQGSRGGDDRQWQGRDGGRDNRPDGRPGYDRDRRDEGGPLANVVREAARERGYDNGRPGYNNNGRNWDRRPVIRPEDRRDRDRNRPRYDERRFPRYITPPQRYRWYGSVWRPPVGYYSFRWQWGQTLPWNWYTPNYYIDDYWRYGLPMPPIGCEWVRVGDDAILVDVFNGRIYQVVYNLFW